MLFLALSDMSMISRVDAYFTNLKFPWDKKPEIQTVVGAVIGYKVKKNQENQLAPWEFERMWVKPYGKQTSVLAWNQGLGLLAVGMDDGFVHGLKVTSENGYKLSEQNVFLNNYLNFSIFHWNCIREEFLELQ